MTPTKLLALLAGIAMLSLGLALASGPVSLTLADIGRALLNHDGSMAADVVWQLRLPRVLAAFACGALLALSGILLQALLRNPLADPHVLGISGGAAVGALSAMLLGAGMVAVQLASFSGALLSMAAVFSLGSLRDERNNDRLLLTGVVWSAGCGTLIILLMTLVQAGQVRGMLFWLVGDLSHPQGLTFAWGLLVVATVGAAGFSGGLDVLSGGQEKAAMRGMAVGRWQAGLCLAAALLAMAALQLGGAIGFVGMMIPHAIRWLGITVHRWLIPLALLLAGSFMVLVDTLARTLWQPLQLPAGIMTALLGVPVLLWLLGRSR